MNKFVNHQEVIQTQPFILILTSCRGGGWLDVSFFDSATLALWPARYFFREI